MAGPSWSVGRLQLKKRPDKADRAAVRLSPAEAQLRATTTGVGGGERAQARRVSGPAVAPRPPARPLPFRWRTVIGADEPRPALLDRHAGLQPAGRRPATPSSSRCSTQEFTDWELILVDDCSPDPAVRERAAPSSPRATRASGDRAGDQRPHRRRLQRRHRGRPRRVHRAARPRRPAGTPTRCARNAEVDRASTPTSTTSTPTRTRSTTTGRHYDAFRKPDWSPERLRGQMYTCHLSVHPHLRGPRGRRLPRGVRRLAGPRPDPAGHRGGPPGRAHPRGPLPLAEHPRLRGRRRRRQAVRRDRGPQGRAGPARPAGHRRRGRPTARRPGSTTSPRRLDPTASVSADRHPHHRLVGDLVWGGRRVFVVEAVRSPAGRDTDHADARGRRRVRRPHARPRCSTSCARSPATG